METYVSDDHGPTQFFLAHIIFDEEHGPILKSYLAHELEIPRIILQGVTTTLFTMAIGVGEPTGEPDTAIIPINVTGIQGRVLIHSFTVEDPEARGRNRIESFMLFIPRTHQDKLLQHSLAFSNILQEAIRDIKIQNNGRNDVYPLEKVFGNIRKVLLTRIDNNIQNLISEICTDQETIVVSDGTRIRAVHNIVLSPDFISLVNELPSLLRVYVDELKAFGTFFDALPIEIHGKTGNQQVYLIAIENNFILAFSSGKGRLGSLFRFFREILWDLNMQGISYADSHISKYSTNIKDKRKSFPQNQYLDTSFELLKSFKPIITDASIIRCSCTLKKAEVLRTSSPQTINKHAFVCQVYNLIDQLCMRLFRTSLTQIVLSQHGSNTIALMWGVNSEKNVALFMVGDSPKGVGL
ncbi:MAG: hypothetical protein ACFE95_22265, partial [Candidatus Hodarchaeota archaeon]